MQYINPIEILGLSNVEDTTSIDNEIVKKAKRKLFADIDLSDNGFFEYYGLQLTKGDCEKVIDELTNNDLKDFYLYLSTNKKLNSFLVNGNNDVFINFKQDSIFKLPEFINFISPYFAPKFDKALLNSFESEDVEQTKSILKTSFLISQSDINIAYKGISNNIQNKITEIDKITKDIKNEESIYDEDDIEDVIGNIKEKFPTQKINLLPQYFQSQILKIAKSINYLQLSIWDAFDNTQVPNDLLEHLLTLNIGGLDKPTFENNYKIVKKKNDERIEQAKNAPLLKKWAGVLLQLRKFIKEVEDKSLSSNSAFEQTKNLFSISELNSLPDFADDIRTQIGYSIRSLSISIWNKHSDIKNAINTINLALEVNMESNDKAKFKEDLLELQELEKKYKGVLVCYFCDKNTPDEKSGIVKNIYSEAFLNSYSSAKVFLPRCIECKQIHIYGNLIFYSLLAIISVSMYFIASSLEYKNSYYSIFGFILAWIISKIMTAFYFKRKKTKSNSKLILKKHPLIKEKFEMNWSFVEPDNNSAIMLLNGIFWVFNFIDEKISTLINKII